MVVVSFFRLFYQVDVVVVVSFKTRFHMRRTCSGFFSDTLILSKHIRLIVSLSSSPFKQESRNLSSPNEQPLRQGLVRSKKKSKPHMVSTSGLEHHHIGGFCQQNLSSGFLLFSFPGKVSLTRRATKTPSEFPFVFHSLS